MKLLKKIIQYVNPWGEIRKLKQEIIAKDRQKVKIKNLKFQNVEESRKKTV